MFCTTNIQYCIKDSTFRFKLLHKHTLDEHIYFQAFKKSQAIASLPNFFANVLLSCNFYTTGWLTISLNISTNKSTNHSRPIFFWFGWWRLMSKTFKSAKARGALWGRFKDKDKQCDQDQDNWRLTTVCVERFNRIMWYQVIVLVNSCLSCLKAQRSFKTCSI